MYRSYIFFLLCIPCRCILAFLASILPDNNLKIMGYMYGLMSIGFMYAFMKKLQNTPGIQGNIWWHDVRPVFALIYLGFSILVFLKNRHAYKFLCFDVIFGLLSFCLLKKYI